jgi:lysozyme
MSALDVARALVTRFEGCKLTAYRDVGGRWTVGWGCTGPDIREGTAWSQAHADAELEKRLQALLVHLHGMLAVEATDGQLGAMASLSYNIGLGNFEGSTVLRAFNRGDIRYAAQAFLLWVKVHGTRVGGLEARRRAERAVFLHVTDSTAPPPGDAPP